MALKLTIPSANITPTYDVGGNHTFPEVWFTVIQEWALKGAIQASGVTNGYNIYDELIPGFDFEREALLDVFLAGGLSEGQPMVLEADRVIFTLPLQEVTPVAHIPTAGGQTVLPSLYKYNGTTQVVKNVGEWGDSTWEIWFNSVTNKVMIYLNPENGQWIDFHMARSLQIYYRTTNFPTLPANSNFWTLIYAEGQRALSPGDWTKLQP